MNKLLAIAVIASSVISGAAFAQTVAPTAPAVKPAATPAIDPAADVKFKAVDKDSSGQIDGAELTIYKAEMAKIDTDKDGKISRAEFAAASKAGVIK